MSTFTKTLLWYLPSACVMGVIHYLGAEHLGRPILSFGALMATFFAFLIVALAICKTGLARWLWAFSAAVLLACNLPNAVAFFHGGAGEFQGLANAILINFVALLSITAVNSASRLVNEA